MALPRKQGGTGATTAAGARASLGAAASGANGDITDLLGVAGAGVRLRASSTTIASAATVDLGAAPTLKVTLTGTATVSSFGTVAHGLAFLRFADALTLALPGAASIVTAPGDTAIATSDASGTWTVRHYSRASGKALVGPTAADITDGTATGRAAVTAASAAALATAAGLGTGNAAAFASLSTTGGVNVGGTFQLGGFDTLQRAGTGYTSLMIGGVQVITAAHNGSEAVTYYSNSGHAWRNKDYTATYATLNSGGFSLNVPASVGSLSATGAVSAGGNLTATGNVSAGGTLQLSGNDVFQRMGTGYSALLIGGIQIVTASHNGSDLKTYYNNAEHVYRSRDYASIYGTLNASAFSLNVPMILGSTLKLGSFTVATLPAGTAGHLVYVTNGRKTGEAAGSGTGVLAYYSNGNWRRPSDDGPVAA